MIREFDVLTQDMPVMTCSKMRVCVRVVKIVMQPS